jgi:hypothetical protein
MIFVIPMISLIHRIYGDRIRLKEKIVLRHNNDIIRLLQNHFVVACANLLQRPPYISASLITTIR